MTGVAWATVGVIAAIFFSAIGLWFTARSAGRDQARQIEDEKAKAVREAREPLLRDIATRDATIQRISTRLDQRESRIEALEDELRQAHRRGGG